MLSAMFSHDPPTGVYSGMIPCANSQQTNAGVLCPARLSSTSSIRSGGNSAGSVGLIGQAVLPPLPGRAPPRRPALAPAASGIAARTAASSRLQPGVQDRVGAGRHALDADLPVGRVEQRQDLGRAVAEVLVRLARRLALGPPGLAGVGDRLERPGLVGAPDRQAHRLAQAVGVLDQLFFDSASGSVTTAGAGLAAAQGRAGRAPGAGALVAVAGLVEHLPDGVGRDRGQAVGGRPQRLPQGAQSDQVAVPSASGVGGRSTSARIRSRAAGS